MAWLADVADRGIRGWSLLVGGFELGESEQDRGGEGQRSGAGKSRGLVGAGW